MSDDGRAVVDLAVQKLKQALKPDPAPKEAAKEGKAAEVSTAAVKVPQNTEPMVAPPSAPRQPHNYRLPIFSQYARMPCCRGAPPKNTISSTDCQSLYQDKYFLLGCSVFSIFATGILVFILKRRRKHRMQTVADHARRDIPATKSKISGFTGHNCNRQCDCEHQTAWTLEPLE